MEIIVSIKINVSLLFLQMLIMLQYLNPVADLFPSALQMIVFVIWFFSSFNHPAIKKGLKISGINIFIFLITLFRCILADQLNMGFFSTLQVVIQRYQFLIYPIIYYYVISLKKKEKEKLFNWALLCITLTVIVSLYYVLCVDPQAIRNTQNVSYFGVGNFQLMYAMAILYGPLLFLAIDKIKAKEKCLFFLLELVLMFICLVLCNLVTSVVITLISVFVTYCLTRKNKLLYTVIGFVLIVFFALRSVWGNLLIKLASKNLFYWSTNNKIIAIANVLLGDMNNTDTLSKRWTLAEQSLNSFKENWVFGINFRDHVMGKVGCHSQWMDDLARYGLIGNVIIWFNYFYIMKITLRTEKNIIVRHYILSAWICFYILGFLNPNLSGTILMAIFVVIPSIDGIIGGGQV